MAVMKGHIIPDTPICVDYWGKTPDDNKKYYRFLSHVDTYDRAKLKKLQEHIYTSPINKGLLEILFGIKPELVTASSVGDPHEFYDESLQFLFSVTMIDARHSAGSVMFLFQGEFGNILYTGAFRFNPITLEHPRLKALIENNSIHILYLDNTFAAEHCKFPARQQVLREIINLIRKHPEHHVLIGIKNYGMEEVLLAIASELKEKVLVSKLRLKVLSYLQCKEDIFTTKQNEARIHAKAMDQIDNVWIKKLQKEKGPVLIIFLAVLHNVTPPGIDTAKSKLKSVLYAPYSDHSCHSELVKFVCNIRPLRIYTVVTTKPEKKENVKKNSKKYTRTLIQKCSRLNALIPESILDLTKAPPLGPDGSPRTIPVIEELEDISEIETVVNEKLNNLPGCKCQPGCFCKEFYPNNYSRAGTSTEFQILPKEGRSENKEDSMDTCDAITVVNKSSCTCGCSSQCFCRTFPSGNCVQELYQFVESQLQELSSENNQDVATDFSNCNGK